MAQAGAPSRLAAIHVSAVRDPRDENQPRAVVEGVDDSVVADPDAVIVCARELLGSTGARIVREAVDRGADSVTQSSLESPVRACRSRMQPYLVLAGRLVPYFRTSSHGSALSRSSRARSAARLSSRYSRRSTSSA